MRLGINENYIDMSTEISIIGTDGFNLYLREIEDFYKDRLSNRDDQRVYETLKRWQQERQIESDEEVMRELYNLIERETGYQMRFLIEE